MTCVLQVVCDALVGAAGVLARSEVGAGAVVGPQLQWRLAQRVATAQRQQLAAATTGGSLS